jgi:hypothetical protein
MTYDLHGLATQTSRGTPVRRSQRVVETLQRCCKISCKLEQRYIHKGAVTSAASWSNVTSTKSPVFCLTTFSANHTHLMVLLPQSRDSSYYVIIWILTPPPLSQQENTDLHEHDFAQFPRLWHKPRSANVSCAASWRLCGINPAILKHHTIQIHTEVVAHFNVLLIRGTKWREWSVSLPGRCIPGTGRAVPSKYEDGWTPGHVWDAAEYRKSLCSWR